MSWPPWHTTAPPLPGVAPASSIQPAVLPNTANSAPTLLPPPSGAIPAGIQYTPEQWAQMQQQNWQQWAQWQQQYQQWHQQYGAEYQKSISAYSSSTSSYIPPPPPTDNKPPPPPPPDDGLKSGQYGIVQHRSSTGYSTVPPLTQNFTNNSNQYSNDWQPSINKRSLPQGDNNDGCKRQMLDSQYQSNKPPQSLNDDTPHQTVQSSISQAQKVLNLEELTEAEKKFDKEFAAWESQFNKWKDQNASHPDKTQYLEYEKKWESWRNSLLDRREQMRKKRVALQTSMSASNPSKLAPIPTQHTFKELHMQNDNISDDIFSKPPPTENNEPLTFKQTTHLLDQNVKDSAVDTENSFLNSTSSPAPGGIPGLDLVKEGLAVENNDEKHFKTNSSNLIHSDGPDLDAISKGINTILGDRKLLNMLSMVSHNQNYSITNSFDSQVQISNISNIKIGKKHDISVPSLLNMPLQHFNSEKSEHEFNTHVEPYNISNKTESVNNFDDQTRMSFSNGPNDQDFDYIGKSNQSNYNSHNNFRKLSSEGRVNTGAIRDNEYRERIFEGNKFGENCNNELQTYNKYSEGEDGIDDQWNEEDEYEKYHNMFIEADQTLHLNSSQKPPSVATQEDGLINNEPLFVPEIVVDYEHKSLKPVEPEVSLDLIRMFDYRHKPVNRIPYPQRPIWLSSTLRNIKQFDPLGTGRFNSNDRIPHFERDQFDRRNDIDSRDFMLNDDIRRYSRETFPDLKNEWNLHNEKGFERGKEINRYDCYSKKDPQTDYHKNFRVGEIGLKKQYSDARLNVEKRIELEELSDDDWLEDKSNSNMESLIFCPRKGNESGPPNLSLTLHPSPLSSLSFSHSKSLDDLLNPPGRYSRPQRIVIILRGPPGSGKTFLAKLIKYKEVELGSSAPRILSLDDYFMVEHEKEVLDDGKLVRVKEMTYEYEAAMEESYRQSLVKAFKKTINDGYFHFVVVDNVNQKVKDFGEMWSYAKQHGFQVYICQLDLDPELCTKRNIHHRSESYIEDCIAAWEPTPSHHPLVDANSFLQKTASIEEVQMVEAEDAQLEDRKEFIC